MRTMIRIAAIVLLIVNGIGALYGGWMLMTDPSGKSLELPLDWLEFSPFNDYLIPGIVLFSVNGLYDLLTAVLVILRSRNYVWFTMVAGVMLMGWISIQILIIRTFYPPLHISYLLIGLFILWCGFLMYKAKKGEVEYAAM